MILVTGGAGFIGSNFVLDWIASEKSAVVNLDKLTYAGNLNNLESLKDNPRHMFEYGDINDRNLVRKLLACHQPRAVVHFAAQSHVDRSIHSPEDFIQTNVNGTFHLLEEARSYWESLRGDKKFNFRFLHISTDEVYGSLAADEPAFSETTPYAPNSPYSASKAAADHLVRAYHHTYGLPTIITNCSNNYGPYQFPEKLIPLMILNALHGKPLPVYGDGLHVRDWLYVGDHCKALRLILARGQSGATYNVGGENERTNLDVVKIVCVILDELSPNSRFIPHASLLTFVKDRPGHDRRYAMNIAKIKNELGWRPDHNFDSGIRKTISWYLENTRWVEAVSSGEYKKWVELNYSNRGMP